MLVNLACHVAKSLGLHQLDHEYSDSLSLEHLEERRKVFWSLYILDKSLSWNAGRSPCLPICDVDVALPLNFNDLALKDYFIAKIRLAQIDEKIYATQYTTQALKAMDIDVSAATNNANALRQWLTDFETLLQDNESNSPFPTCFKLELKIQYHILCFLAERPCIGRPGSSSEVIAEARSCIQCMLQLWAQTASLSSYAALPRYVHHNYPTCRPKNA
jgi:Fungal specific transcription factor domain